MDMGFYTNQKLSFIDLLSQIPKRTMALLEKNTKVNYYSKVLTGEIMFYLLLYGLLKKDKLSQRGLTDIYESTVFRLALKIKGKKTIAHSSISERLSSMNVEFFRQTYDLIYKQFSSLYTTNEITGLNLQRVDSTLVTDVSGKIGKALINGNQHSSKRKMIKFTINFDGMFPSYFKFHNEPKYCSESFALPENVFEHFKKEKDHAPVYIIDRGQSSAESFEAMKSEETLSFVGRLSENRKLFVTEERDVENVDFSTGILISDQTVKLYKTVKKEGQDGKIQRSYILVDETFRVIRFKPDGKDNPIVLITNLDEMSAQEIADIYRRRWDIEVFFRFIKQELNFSHFLSLSENGIEIMLYMTMITAMLVMIYKRENKLGYTESIRRMNRELEEDLIKRLMVIAIREEDDRRRKLKLRGYLTDDG